MLLCEGAGLLQMAPPQPKAAANAPAAPVGGVQKAALGKPRNYDLGNGVVRFSKTKMFHKKVRNMFLLNPVSLQSKMHISFHKFFLHKCNTFIKVKLKNMSSQLLPEV